jgi:hypothetical protein
MLRYRGEAPPPTPIPTLDHAPVYPQFMPSHETSAGENREAEARLHPAPTAATGIPALTSIPMFSSQNSLLSGIGELLAILVLALVGLMIRRRVATVPVVETVTETLGPAISLPPLYVNEYSPIAEPTSSPSLPWWTQLEQSQNAQTVQSTRGPISSADGILQPAVTSTVSTANGQFQPFATGSVSTVDGIPQLSFDEPVTVQASHSSLRPGGLRARRLVQVSSDVTSSISVNQESVRGSYPVTEEMLPLGRPGLSLPGRVLEPVANGATREVSLAGRVPELVTAGAGTRPTGGGLLRRYGMEQVGKK